MTESEPTTSTSGDNSHAQMVQQTQAQLEAIEIEIKETQPLTSEVRNLGALKKHYESDSSSKYFEKGVDYLSKTYGTMRMIRGDGNCYYRAFLYSLSETLMTKDLNKDEMDRILKYGRYLKCMNT
jgi:ubiquitin thioesterase protein OTUB1